MPLDPLSLTQVGAEMRSDFGIPGPTTVFPERHSPCGGAAAVLTCSFSSRSGCGNRGGDGKSPFLHSGSLIFCECYTALQNIGAYYLQFISSKGVCLCPQRVKVFLDKLCQVLSHLWLMFN